MYVRMPLQSLQLLCCPVALLLALWVGTALPGVSFAPSSAWAAAPASVSQSMNFQGFLADPSGAPLSGLQKVRVAILAGSTKLWYAEYTDVVVTAGYFSIQLGSSSQGGSALDP